MDLKKHVDRVIFTARIITFFIVLEFESAGIFFFLIKFLSSEEFYKSRIILLKPKAGKKKSIQTL